MQIVPNSSSLYTLFYFVIYNSVTAQNVDLSAIAIKTAINVVVVLKLFSLMLVSGVIYEYNTKDLHFLD